MAALKAKFLQLPGPSPTFLPESESDSDSKSSTKSKKAATLCELHMLFHSESHETSLPGKFEVAV